MGSRYPGRVEPFEALGAILAGGESRRMGTDKALVPVDGVPMVERVAAALTAVVGAAVVVGRTGTLAGLPCLPDDRPGHRGPLAGLATTLRRAGDRALLVVGVDQPFVRPETLRKLLGAAVPGRALIPIADSVRQVTCAVYPGSWAEEAAAEVEAGGSVQSLLDRLPYREVLEPEWRAWGEDGRSWWSVDTLTEATEGLARFG